MCVCSPWLRRRRRRRLSAISGHDHLHADSRDRETRQMPSSTSARAVLFLSLCLIYLFLALFLTHTLSLSLCLSSFPFYPFKINACNIYYIIYFLSVRCVHSNLSITNRWRTASIFTTINVLSLQPE